MKSFKKFIEAEKYAKEVSAKNLKPVSIVRLPCGKKYKDGYSLDFTVMDTKDEWHWGVEYVMLITNYKTPFEVKYISPKRGLITQAFPTKELRDIRFKELLSDKYWKDISRRDLTTEQYFNDYIKPFEQSLKIQEEYRKKLLTL
jgi:hypothetical protein